MARIPKFIEGTAFGILNDIIAGYSDDNGYAQPNRYEILILPPPKLGGGNQESLTSFLERKSDTRQISLRAQNVTMPGRNLSTAQEGNIYGPDREIVEGVTYADEISVQFQASSGLDERVFFENWQKLAFNEKTWNIGYYFDYTSSIEIYILDKQDKRRYGIKLWEVFPKTIGANELAYESINTLMLLPVNFTFRYWTSLDQNQNPAVNIKDRIFETVINSAERNISRNIPSVFNKLGRNI
tara:strand:- start:276 stop:998 length:723 start_codon:yes stop_codon:yes gene_type:complete